MLVKKVEPHQIKTCRNCGRFTKCEKTLKCWGVNPDDENNEAIRVCALGWRPARVSTNKKRTRMPQVENEGT